MRAVGAGVFKAPQGNVVRTVKHGVPVQFLVTNPKDVIQQYHNLGRFYEEDELNQIRRFFPFGGTYVDIGANIGNHALYVAKFLRPKKIIPFEPHPTAIEMFVTHMMLNDVADLVDFSHIGVGVGPADAGFGFITPHWNLGATKLAPGRGDVKTIPADDALKNEQVDFIKIDVEGMEMQVLSTLTETFVRCRPNALVEVDTENRDAFQLWINDNDYRVAVRFRQFKDNQNFLIVPKPNP